MIIPVIKIDMLMLKIRWTGCYCVVPNCYKNHHTKFEIVNMVKLTKRANWYVQTDGLMDISTLIVEKLRLKN